MARGSIVKSFPLPALLALLVALLLAAVPVVNGAPQVLDVAVKNQHERLTQKFAKAVEKSTMKVFEASATSSSRAGNSATKLFLERRELQSLEPDSITCIIIHQNFNCGPLDDSASCSANSYCTWNTTMKSCNMKMSQTQEANYQLFLKDYRSLFTNTCQRSGSCPTDKCFGVDNGTSCAVRQASFEAFTPNDIAVAKYYALYSKCAAYLSETTCTTDSECSWSRPTCGMEPVSTWNILRNPMRDCGAAGTPVGSRTAAEHIANHDLCPHTLGVIKCDMIKSESECTPSRTNNTCEWSTPNVNVPARAVYPCTTTDKHDEAYGDFLQSDLLTLYELLFLCTPHTTLAACEAAAGCGWFHSSNTCGVTSEQVYKSYAAHPHMEVAYRASRTCSPNLKEEDCQAPDCVWAPSSGNAPGECLQTPTNFASHAACMCDSVKTTFPDLNISESVCPAPPSATDVENSSSAENSSRATRTIVGIIVTAATVLLSSH